MILFRFENGTTTTTLPVTGTIRSSIKAGFTFPYHFLNMELDHETLKVSGQYAIEGTELIDMTAEQTLEVRQYMDAIVFDKTVSDAHHKNNNAMRFLTSTDWIESKYVRDVIREKTLTDLEFSTKYADLIAARAIAVLDIVAIDVPVSV